MWLRVFWSSLFPELFGILRKKIHCRTKLVMKAKTPKAPNSIDSVSLQSGLVLVYPHPAPLNIQPLAQVVQKKIII